jgi:MFS family permease
MEPIIEKNLRFNYILGLFNGAMIGFAEAVASPSLTLALFITQLGGSSFLVGLLSAIYKGGWFIPQFLVAHRLQRLPLMRPVYATAAFIRIICWLLIALATYTIASTNPSLLLAIFFVLMTIYSFVAGLAGNAYMTMIAKIIPMNRRGSFFGWGEFCGTAAALLAGYLVAVVLSPERDLVFPENFGLLFVLTFGAVGSGLLLFAQVREPREVITGEEITFSQQVRAARGLVTRNPIYSRYLLTRFILSAGDLATPFYAIFAIKQLGAPVEIVGLYIGVTTLTALLSTPILSWLSDHHRLTWVLLLAAGTTPLIPLIAFGFGAFAHGPDAAFAFSLIFALYGIARTAANISFPTYLLNIAPPAERTLYIGFTNTTLGIATFIPIIGGTLLDLFGFAPLFIITFLMASIGFWFALGLRQTPHIPAASL